MGIGMNLRFCAIVLISIALFMPGRALADDTLAAAQALFDDAIKLMADGSYEIACSKLEDVVKLQPAKIGARWELAGCYEKWGKVASAWSRYRSMAVAAAAGGDGREADARAKIDVLAKMLPKLTVAVAPENSEMEGFTIKRDGRVLGLSEWDAAMPIDPGEYVMTAETPGKKSWTGSVTIAIGDAPATIEIPVLVDELPPTAGNVPLAPKLPQAQPLRPADKHEPTSVDSGARTRSWIIGAGGIAALGVAAGFGINGQLAQKELEAMCSAGPHTPCTGHGADEINPLNAQKNLGLGMFIGFGAAGVVGVLVGVDGIVNRRKMLPANTSVLVPIVGTGFGGVVVQGHF
jgi:hypothetical protein